MGDYYDRQGQPLTVLEWARLFENRTYAVIQQNGFKNLFLSTVWLGINNNFFGRGPPVIFETMIFWGDEPGPMWRYCTEAAARRNHKKLLMIMQGTILRKQLSKKWTRREQKKLVYKLSRL